MEALMVVFLGGESFGLLVFRESGAGKFAGEGL